MRAAGGCAPCSPGPFCPAPAAVPCRGCKSWLLGFAEWNRSIRSIRWIRRARACPSFVVNQPRLQGLCRPPRSRMPNAQRSFPPAHRARHAASVVQPPRSNPKAARRERLEQPSNASPHGGYAPRRRGWHPSCDGSPRMLRARSSQSAPIPPTLSQARKPGESTSRPLRPDSRQRAADGPVALPLRWRCAGMGLKTPHSKDPWT